MNHGASFHLWTREMSTELLSRMAEQTEGDVSPPFLQNDVNIRQSLRKYNDRIYRDCLETGT